MTRPPPDLRLYLVMDPTLAPEGEVERLLLDAVRGGVTLVQVREKSCSNAEFIALAQKTARVLRPLGIPLIVNDRVDVALQVGAQGVHVGQSDLHWSEARRLLGEQAIVGVSVENLQQATDLAGSAIDYLGISSVFPTLSKPDINNIWGLSGVRTLREATSLPLVGIGGIDASNAGPVIHAGADGIAVVSAICSSPRPGSQAQKLRALVDQSLALKKGVPS